MMYRADTGTQGSISQTVVAQSYTTFFANMVSLIELFALCKDGNFNIHIWAGFNYFFCYTREIGFYL